MSHPPSVVGTDSLISGYTVKKKKKTLPAAARQPVAGDKTLFFTLFGLF